MLAASKERVLVVDDEPQVLVALEDLLSERFIVMKTESAEEALNIAEREPDIAVVVTDQRMPRMNGDQLLAKLGQSSEASRILVTGFADLSAVIRALNDGKIFAYVAKPWNPEDLRFKVQSAADQFRLSRELMHERKLLHDLMDNVPDGIYFKDRDLRILRANRAFGAMLNVEDSATLVGRRLSDLVPRPVHAADAESEERGVLREGRPITDVVRKYEFGSKPHWLSETKAAIKNGDHVVGLVGIARNVTRQRELEAELVHAQKMEAIGRFAGGVAHDFNNLLAVILSYTELCARAGGSAQLGEDLTQIRDAANRGAGLTRQLLALSRRQVVEPKAVRMDQLVSAVDKMLRRIIGEDIELTLTVSTEGTIVADPGQIEQILLNLVINARDAMPDGGKLAIEVSNAHLDRSYADTHTGVTPGDFVALTVTDTGAGMDAATQERIFEPFFTTKEVGKGTGLGLATVYGIVNQSGGHVSVESELGRGTTFRLYFQRVDAPVKQESQSTPRTAQKPATETILLLEDDPAVRRVAARILRAQGYVILEAGRPSEATRLCDAEGTRVDLLLVDLILPETSGVKFAEQLTAAHPDVKILFMSGYPGSVVAESQSKLDRPYIEKPFTPQLLAEKVRDVLDGNGSRSA